MFPKLTLFFPNENQHIEFLFIQTIEMRSEERRVGKEC